MIASVKNNIWGRVYNLAEGAFVCTSSGRFVKLASLGLRQFGFEAIKIDRNKFAQLLREHRKSTRCPN